MLPQSNELDNLYRKVHNKTRFKCIDEYLLLSSDILKYIKNNLTELHAYDSTIYSFFIRNEEINNSDIKRTRPFNSMLMFSYDEFSSKLDDFKSIIYTLKSREQVNVKTDGKLITRIIYTIQQCIGFILDIASNNKSDDNGAKNNVGWHFENILKCFFNYMLNDHGISCKSKNICGYRHDLVF